MSQPVFCLYSFAREGRKHAGIRNDNEQLFIWCICDKSLHGMKSKRSGSKIGASMSLVQQIARDANCFINFLKHAVSCVDAIPCDEFTNSSRSLTTLSGGQICS